MQSVEDAKVLLKEAMVSYANKQKEAKRTHRMSVSERTEENLIFCAWEPKNHSGITRKLEITVQHGEDNILAGCSVDLYASRTVGERKRSTLEGFADLIPPLALTAVQGMVKDAHSVLFQLTEERLLTDTPAKTSS